MSVDNHPDIWGHAAVRDPKLPTYLRTPLGWSNKLTRLLWQRTFRHAWVDEHQLLWGNTTESYDNPIRWQQWEKPSRDSPRSSGLCGPNTDWMVTTAWLFSIIQQVWFWSSGPELWWCQSELRVPDGSRQAAGVATYPPTETRACHTLLATRSSVMKSGPSGPGQFVFLSANSSTALLWD